jgi:hypothetical protein
MQPSLLTQALQRHHEQDVNWNGAPRLKADRFRGLALINVNLTRTDSSFNAKEKAEFVVNEASGSLPEST